MTKTYSTPSQAQPDTQANAHLEKKAAPYGAWPSPINSTLLTANTVRLSEPKLDNGHCYWLEQRPEEKGRCVVVRQTIHASSDDHTDTPADKTVSHDKPSDVTPSNMSVRTKAQEYGGGSYTVHNGTVYFVNASDQRIYAMPVDQSTPPMALSPESSDKASYYYADFFIDEPRQQLIGICEIHRQHVNKSADENANESTNENTNESTSESNNNNEPESNIVSLRLDGSSTIGFNVLVFGNDFYSNPSVSPDGEKLVWLTWNHPNMPWDNSECWIADFNHFGMLHKHRKVAGGISANISADKTTTRGESVFQPQWSPTGDLLFVSDRNNWWNIYSYNTYNKYTETLIDMPAEFATPQWVFGMSTYGFLNSYTLFCTYTQNGQWQLASVDLMSHTVTQLDVPFSHIEGIACQDDDDTALFIGASETSLPELIRWKKDRWDVIAQSSTLALATDNISIPSAITFKNKQQDDVHGFFYAAKNAEYQPCNTQGHEQPPLIVMCHGGPTGATSAALNLKIQYWTTRGFAVFDINYSGSTGYGREYRQRLYHQWGVLDVSDLCAGADYLSEQGLVNTQKMAIRGSSAGGYSVLAALTFHDQFKAGASLYGIGDLSALIADTHKFESRYCDQLIGEYPKEKALYEQRSPINHIEQLNCPVIFLQGSEDKVVPPNQAETMVQALHQKNIPVAYVNFAGEGHGFRQAENIRHAIDVEYAFYASIFEIDTQEILPQVPFITEVPFITSTQEQP